MLDMKPAASAMEKLAGTGMPGTRADTLTVKLREHCLPLRYTDVGVKACNGSTASLSSQIGLAEKLKGHEGHRMLVTSSKLPCAMLAAEDCL